MELQGRFCRQVGGAGHRPTTSSCWAVLPRFGVRKFKSGAASFFVKIQRRHPAAPQERRQGREG